MRQAPMSAGHRYPPSGHPAVAPRAGAVVFPAVPVRILSAAGRALLVVGLLVLLFVAYQLWGTGLLEARSQAGLRAELLHELPPAARHAEAGAGTEHGARAAAGAERTSHPSSPASQPAAAGRSTGARAVAGGSRGSAPAVAPPTAAPSTGQPVGVLQIPSIGLDQVVVEGVQTAQLRTGPGHYPGTPLPGQAGNAAIAGHRTTYARPFYGLGSVAPGDPIVVTTPQGIFTYTTRSLFVVSPSNVSVLDPTGGDDLTLTTCNPPYSAATRLVLRAVLARSVLFTTAGGATAGGDRHGGSRGAGDRPAKDRAGRGRTADGSTGRAGLAVGGPARAAADGTGGPGGSGLAGNPSGGAWPAAAGWGLLAVVVAVAGRIVGRRARRPWAVYLPAALLLLVVLFAFFTAVTPLLPATL